MVRSDCAQMGVHGIICKPTGLNHLVVFPLLSYKKLPIITSCFWRYTMDSDYFLHLTDVGREVAEQIYEKHRFFTECLIAAGVDPKTAEADACRIEHVISDESFQKLKKQLM